MCEQCHYLTNVLMQIIDDNARLRKFLLAAETNGDAEQITSINRLLQETLEQVWINEARMKDHLFADHNGLGAMPTGGPQFSKAGPAV